jgi:phospholipid-binding lipoprotein MlaA
MKTLEVRRGVPRLRGWIVLVVCACLVGCASTGERRPDRFEPVNRKVYGFNDTLDRWILRPVAKGYDRAVPRPVKRGIRNVFINLGTPGVALNQFLQGKPGAGMSDLTRFVINSTVGVAGIFDVAGRSGLPRHEEDFGQTFAVWGFGQGPFVMLPFRGPATTTHAVGMVFDLFTNPVMLVSPARDRAVVIGVDVVDVRAQLIPLESLITGDPYIFMRDAYLQRRDFLISDGVLGDDPFLDDFDDEYDDADDW